MIKKISTSNIGPITSEVEIDLEYKNLVTNSKGNIDIDKQVWIKNRLRLVSGIIGKNSTGKSSFWNFVGVGQALSSYKVIEWLIRYFKNTLEKQMKDNNPDIFIKEKYDKVEIDKEIFNFTNYEIENINQDLDIQSIVKETTSIIINHFFISGSNLRDQSTFKYEKYLDEDIISYEYKLIKENQSYDLIFKIDGHEYSFSNELRLSIMPKYQISDNHHSITFNFVEIYRTLQKFFCNIERDFFLITSYGRNPNFFDCSQNITNTIADLIQMTSWKFIEKLLTSIDPSIKSIEKQTNNQFSIIINDQKVSSDWLSSGTQKLITSVRLILKTFKEGKLIFFDEIENGLQMKIVKLILNLFTNEKMNRLGAQIIFSTHNISFMDHKIKYINLKNLFIFYKDKNVKIMNYWNWASSKKIRIENRNNFSKCYLDDSDKEYDFMLTREEEELLIKEIEKHYS